MVRRRCVVTWHECMRSPMSEAADLSGPILVVGTGLVGTSIGLAATRAGLPVWLSDLDSTNLSAACALGAGTAAPTDASAPVVVVAVPPADVADAVVKALRSGAVVTDVASVKAAPVVEVTDRVGPQMMARYVGSHPMAGSARSGPSAASADLFVGRPWVVTPNPHSDPSAVRLVHALIRVCGARPVMLSPHEHDVAVAVTSHVPHLLAALAAGQLAQASPEQLATCGPGVRDVTRVAAADPDLWLQILTSNSEAVSDQLATVRRQLDEIIAALADSDRDRLHRLLARGVAGTRAIPPSQDQHNIPRTGSPQG